MRTWNIAKGHGTENDFVILVDRHDLLSPSDDDVRLLCDRRRGVGGDGFLRAIKAEHIPEWEGDPEIWFMDYRNADGSIAQMCGNGVRVFALFLTQEGLVNEPVIPIGTRAGLRTATIGPGGKVTVAMGPAVVADQESTVRFGEREFTGDPVDVGNPHLVAVVDDVAAVQFVDGPHVDPAVFADGVNVEVIEQVGPGHIRMRVHERGVGETRSCGTGTVAAAAVAQRRFGGDGHWRVDVPGGTLGIQLGDEAIMTGPAEIVFKGTVHLPDLERAL